MMKGLRWHNPIAITLIILTIGSSFKYFNNVYYGIASEEYLIMGGTSIYFIEGVLLANVATLFYVLGYFLFSEKDGDADKYNSLDKSDKKYSAFWILLYYSMMLCSLVLTVIFMNEMGIIDDLMQGNLAVRRYYISEDGVRTSLSFLSIGKDILFAFALIEMAYRRKLTTLIVVIFSISLLVQMLSGGRTVVFISMLSFLILTALVKNMHRNVLIFRNVIIILGISAVAVTTLLRTDGRRNLNDEFNISSLSEGLSQSLSDFVEGAYSVGYDKLAVIQTEVDERNSYLWGQSFLLPIIAPVPRLLWPEKPSVRLGQYVGTDIYKRTNQSGVPPSLPGEFYINFGWLGVALGMVILGGIASRVYSRVMRASGDNPYYVVFFSFFTVSVTFTMFVSDFTGGVMSLLTFSIALFVAHRALGVILRRTKNKSAHRRPMHAVTSRF